MVRLQRQEHHFHMWPRITPDQGRPNYGPRGEFIRPADATQIRLIKLSFSHSFRSRLRVLNRMVTRPALVILSVIRPALKKVW